MKSKDETSSSPTHPVGMLFGVKVADVRTSIVMGKTKKAGRYQGKRPDWKKAWVRLAPGCT